MKIKAINYQTSSCQEKILTPEMENLNKCIIGRHPNCDLVLNAPEVSRIHGMIYAYQQNYYFIDLASSDGSRINNQEMEGTQSYLLKPNDVIHIGDFLLLIEEIQLEEHQSNQFTAWRSPELTARCVRIINETPDVKTFTFVAEPAVEFTYQPGQFVTLELEINGKIVKRAYSISSTPSRPHSLDITVKRASSPNNAADAPPGLVSNWLHDNLKIGSQIKLCGGAMGKFTCGTNPPPKLLMISAGSGITPMLSMARWLYDTAINCDLVFFYSDRTPNDIIMRQELELLASRQSNFRLAITVTRPKLGQPWHGFTGRLTEEMLLNIAPDFRERVVYVCGANSFMQGVKTMLTSLDFPMENYHEESFGAQKKPKIESQAEVKKPSLSVVKPSSVPAQTASKPVLVFSQSGKEVLCDEEESVLAVAQQHDIKIRAGCMQGVCGACKTRKLDGQVKYQTEPDGLEQCDRDLGYILPCIAFPVGKVAIEA
ncbi:MAG: FHA domain-containing protein [Nostocaceae cyanobacterium CSU_2_110]|nr:FHA domain-containing protein [Nostocaceae cyanobacterium CSU_2_110]